MNRLFLQFLICFHLISSKGNGQNSLRGKYREWIEDNDRVEVRSWYAETEVSLQQDWTFEFLGTIDAWSGATPNGLPPNKATLSNPNEWLNLVPEEIRKAGLFNIGKESSEYLFGLEYGISDEPDYLSKSYAIKYSHKLAADTLLLSSGFSFQDDSVKNFNGDFETKKTPSIAVGLTRILDKFTSISINFTYSYPSGYLSDPYKAIPVDERFAWAPDEIFLFEENRPEEREIIVFYTEISRYLESLELGTHFSYRYFQDDHDLSGHTLEFEFNRRIGDRWIWSPRYRYYTQNQSSFYSSLTRKYESFMDSPNRFNGPFYSADYRLSDFDSHTLGLKFTYLIMDDLKLDAGIDRYLTKGRDGMTKKKVYPEANVFTVGLQWEY